MFDRSKLRKVLTKHQSNFHAANAADYKTRFGSARSCAGQKLTVENVEDIGEQRRTPVEYFTYNDGDFNYVKSRIEPKDYTNMDIFHRAVSPILTMGQCFGLMPVVGVGSANPKNLRFSFVSLHTLIAVLFLAASSMFTMAITKHLMQIGINAKNFVGFVFFACVQSAAVLFFSLALRWPRMVRYWTRVELLFTRKPYEEPVRKLATRVRFAAAIIIILSLVEHGLYQASALLSYTARLRICATQNGTSSALVFDEYIRANYDYVFEVLPYNSFIGACVLIINGTCTFVWNYMDLFVMMVSKGLAYRFEQITARINKLVELKDVPESTFIEIREHYIKLCELLECVDENLSGIILLSCINSLYFVCYQLLNVFNKLRWPINYIYFWYSLLYLIGRTTFVFLTAATINDESKGGLAVLRRVSSKAWCVEVERLIFQMTTQTVALSGKKFYFLTRRLLFGMAGTIVTYELVLLQFDEPNRTLGLPDLCQ